MFHIRVFESDLLHRLDDYALGLYCFSVRHPIADIHTAARKRGYYHHDELEELKTLKPIKKTLNTLLPGLKKFKPKEYQKKRLQEMQEIIVSLIKGYVHS